MEKQIILCPNCFEGQVVPHSKGEDGTCDKCLTEFVYKAPTTVKFK